MIVASRVKADARNTSVAPTSSDLTSTTSVVVEMSVLELVGATSIGSVNGGKKNTANEKISTLLSNDKSREAFYMHVLFIIEQLNPIHPIQTIDPNDLFLTNAKDTDTLQGMADNNQQCSFVNIDKL